MADSGDDHPQKKRRVTRACDQCRRRRIKCEAYPRAQLDAPCVICTEAGNATQCTFSRPAKKRGPQAGKAKSLEDRCAAFERLVGYLLPIVPSLEAHVEAFAAASGAPASGVSPSPDGPTPSSSSTSLTSSDALQAAYTASRIPDLMDSVLPPLVPAREAAKLASKRGAGAARANSSSGADAQSAHPLKKDEEPPHPHPHPPPFFGVPPGGFAPSLSDPHAFGPGTAALPFPAAGTGTGAGAGPLALQALADAAVPDFDPRPHAHAHAHAEGGQGGGAGKGRAAAEEGAPFTVPDLPSEGTRNALLDLYFSHVGQTCLPMLDKSRFLRWSAHLPPRGGSAGGASSSSTAPAAQQPPPALALPPALYLSVFALSASYLPPSSPLAHSTHPPHVWARAARAHLLRDVLLLGDGGGEGVTLETCQAAVFPAAALLRLKTVHSVLVVHALASLRVGRAPLAAPEDWDVPPLPRDEVENWDLWRADKGTGELWDDNALLTFSRLSQLCHIALAVLRHDVCPLRRRGGDGEGLAAREHARMELVAALRAWEDALEEDLRLGLGRAGAGAGAGTSTGTGEGADRVAQRARWTVEMQMLAAALYLKLRPHPSFASVAPDPVPHALGLVTHVLSRFRTSFTLLRSLPTLDATLHLVSRALFDQADYAPHHHDAVLRAYDEMGRVWPTARSSWVELATKVDEHKRELGLLRGIHPTTSSHPTSFSAPAPAPVPAPAPAPIAEPFQAFLGFSHALGPQRADAQTVLDFGSWDQTDLLVSLGLVMDPAGAATGAAGAFAQGGGGGGGGAETGPGGGAGAWQPLEGWGDPNAGAGAAAAAAAGPIPLQLPIEGVFGGTFPHAQTGGGGGVGGTGMDIHMSTSGSSGTSAYFASPLHPHQAPEQQQQQQPHAMAISPPSSSSASQPPPPPPGPGPAPTPAHAHVPALAAAQALSSLPGAPSPFPSAAPSPAAGGSFAQAPEAAADGMGTDLLTRWLDRGSLGFAAAAPAGGPAATATGTAADGVAAGGSA
ncbi:hypothetical protein DMC30DRAFT_415264 [Rhodotorula diobovata]|uniref:Zn(2)-C6 fungal-type domain-containing protein n=1 Tax=Rhodotorula diobovata TaxID=5288 RepID=A0A5C5G2V2_9BASI|nr:hypothetical protein DMC30DRAFT_415264 [Rhodotorula diobovata]